MPLIGAEQEFLLWAVLIALVGIGFWAEQKTKIGRKLTGLVITMTLAMIFANLRVLPTASPVYDTILSQLLPVAIAMMLFRANIRQLFSEAGPMLVAFGIGAVGSLLGIFLATMLVPLGEITAQVAGMYTATYIGGSGNFFAVVIATDFPAGSTLTSIIAADIIVGQFQMIILILLPGFLLMQRLFMNVHANAAHARNAGPLPEVADAPVEPFHVADLNLAGLALALGVAAILVVLGDWIAGLINDSSLAILVTSALALVVANGFPGVVRRMSGDFEIALFFIFLFLAAIAAAADVWVLLETGPIFFIYVTIVLVVHTLFTLVVGRLLKIDLAELIIGSTACIGGLVTASAIASAKGWRGLIAPGIMVGTFGNAIGAFVGVWIWKLLS